MPEASRGAYRHDYAICPAWSELNRLVSCRLKAGIEVVIGNTQSADCGAQGGHPKSANLQVYVRNDAAAGHLEVEDCRDEGPWPDGWEPEVP